MMLRCLPVGDISLELYKLAFGLYPLTVRDLSRSGHAISSIPTLASDGAVSLLWWLATSGVAL